MWVYQVFQGNPLALNQYQSGYCSVSWCLVGEFEQRADAVEFVRLALLAAGAGTFHVQARQVRQEHDPMPQPVRLPTVEER